MVNQYTQLHNTINHFRKILIEPNKNTGIKNSAIEETNKWLEQSKKDLNSRAKLDSQIPPIMEISSRVKATESIMTKLTTNSLNIIQKEIDNASNTSKNIDYNLIHNTIFAQFKDVIGFRIICSSKQNIFSTVEKIHKMLRDNGLAIISEKNFVQPTGPSTKFAKFDPSSKEVQRNYYSYHLTFEFVDNAGIKTPIEIQIRTYGMQFYAQLEHEIMYKSEYRNRYSLLKDNLDKFVAQQPNLKTKFDTETSLVRRLRILSNITDMIDIEFDNIYQDIINANRPDYSIILSHSDTNSFFTVRNTLDQPIYQSSLFQASTPNKAEIVVATKAINYFINNYHQPNHFEEIYIYHSLEYIEGYANGTTNTKESKSKEVTALKKAVKKAGKDDIHIYWRKN